MAKATNPKKPPTYPGLTKARARKPAARARKQTPGVNELTWQDIVNLAKRPMNRPAERAKVMQRYGPAPARPTITQEQRQAELEAQQQRFIRFRAGPPQPIMRPGMGDVKIAEGPRPTRWQMPNGISPITYAQGYAPGARNAYMQPDYAGAAYYQGYGAPTQGMQPGLPPYYEGLIAPGADLSGFPIYNDDWWNSGGGGGWGGGTRYYGDGGGGGGGYKEPTPEWYERMLTWKY